MSVNECGADDRGRISRLIPVLVGAACLAPFAPLVTHRDAIVSDAWRDYSAMHLPLAEFAREELLAGRLPLWNPYVACGQPLQAAQQAMLFYPLSTSLCLACGANLGLKLALFAHLALCYTGTYLLARRANLSRYAGAYAGLVATWSGALMGHLAEGHAGAVFESALVPWFFLALISLLGSPGPIAAVRLALIGSLCALAAQPQVLYYTVVAGAFWAAGSLWGGGAARHRWRAVGWTIVAAMVAMLIASVQLAPVFELLRDGLAESERGTAQFGATFALDGADSARLLMPYLNGTPFAGVPQFAGADYYHERVVYLGLSALPLAAYGLSRVGASRWQWAVAWGVVAALAVAFGDSTPAFGLLGRVLPGLLLFRCPGRVFLVASAPAALLAARGLDALARGEPRAGARGLLGLATVALAAVNIPVYAALELIPSFEWQRYLPYAREHLLGDLSLWATLGFDAAAIVGLASWRCLRGRAVWLPLIVVAALDVGYFNVGNFRMEERETPAAAELPPADSTTRFVEAAGFGHIRYDALRYSGWTRAAIINHRPAIGAYDGGVLPAATARLYRSIETNPGPALALAACGFAWSGTGRAAAHPHGALPRIRFVSAGVAVADLTIEAVHESDVESLKRLLAPVRLISDAPRRLEIEVNAPTDGWLVVADTHYPGWICRVDGLARSIKRAHGVFRRVPVVAGQRRIVMSYEPLSFRIGLCLTLGGIVLSAAMIVLPLAMRRREAGPAASSEAEDSP